MRGKVPSDFMSWSTSRVGLFAPRGRCRIIVDPCAIGQRSIALFVQYMLVKTGLM